jgi:hypothetical protein
LGLGENIMNELVTYLLNEDYHFELKCESGGVSELNIPIFGGHLILLGDGTWTYEED